MQPTILVSDTSPNHLLNFETPELIIAAFEPQELAAAMGYGSCTGKWTVSAGLVPQRKKTAVKR